MSKSKSDIERENKLITLLEEQKRQEEVKRANKEYNKQQVQKWVGWLIGGGLIGAFLAFVINAPFLLPIFAIMLIVGMILVMVS